MQRPYDEHFMNAMDETTKYLCENIQGCKFGYVQSDEISLLLTDFETITTDAWFDGQVQKIVSIAAALATGKFNQLMMTNGINNDIKIEEIISIILNKDLAQFDARVFTIADPTEVENYFIWRQKDAVRNSLQMHAQSLYSHKELNGKSQVEQHDMIHAKGENWDKLPDGFKRGRNITKYRIYDVETIDNLIDHGTTWKINPAYDYLKERDELTNLIPKL